MDPYRKLWNTNHQKLTRLLAKGDRESAIELFLDQHAMVHSAKATRSKLWSFEDALLNDMTDEEVRQIPARDEHSIAWILFHLTRIEDITMNMLVAGTDQLFTQNGWAKKLNLSVLHSANNMHATDIAELSASIDLNCLRDYRAAVARRTREIVKKLQATDFKQTVQTSRIERVLREGAVSPEAIEIATYWSRKTIAGLLLMPATRHCILHWNEAQRIKEKVRKGK